MNEYPVFIPYANENLAAVITVPDDQDASAVALLLTGTGAPRSHRFQLWTRTARELARLGVASVRMDYRGFGDSTGRLLQPVLGDQRLEQAVAVARFAMDAVGVSRLGVAGNCSGGIVTLGVASKMPECEIAVCILPRIVQLGSMNRRAIQARTSRVGTMLRSSKVLHAVVRKGMKGVRDVASPAVREAFEPALRHAQVLFIYSEHDRDAYVEKSRRLLANMRAKLPSDLRQKLRIETTTQGPLHGFENLSVQQFAIGRVADELGAALGRSVERTGGAGLRVGSSPRLQR